VTIERRELPNARPRIFIILLMEQYKTLINLWTGNVRYTFNPNNSVCNNDDHTSPDNDVQVMKCCLVTDGIDAIHMFIGHWV